MATITASSASQADVITAIGLAVTGDTVNVPAGSAAWPLMINLGNKAISIIGAGSGSTIITNTSGNGSIIQSSATGNNLVRISGFRVNGHDGMFSSFNFYGPSFKVRVDYCIFDKGDSAVGTNNQGPGFATGPVYGVQDHNQYINMTRPYFPMDIRVGGPSGEVSWMEWTNNPTIFPGTDKMMYLEDCTFTYDTNAPCNCQSPLYGQYGGKACIRRCTSTTWCTFSDAHPGGDEPTFHAAAHSGHIYYEMYENTITESTPLVTGAPRCGFPVGGALCSQGYFCRQDGGTYIAHNNTFTGSLPFGLTVYYTGQVDQIKDSYFWNNTWVGHPTDNQIGVSARGSAPLSYVLSHVRENIEYFKRAPQLGEPLFPLAPYSQLRYPHPLVEPPGPAISVSPSTLDFGAILVGSTKDLSASVTNSGGIGTVSGSASTSVPFSIVSGSPYSVTTGTADVGVRYSPTSAINTSANVLFTGGGGSSIVAIGSGVTLQAGLTFAGNAGTLSIPFQGDGGGHVYQAVDTTLVGSGRMAYGFTIVTAGDYTVNVNTKAESTGSNSFYVNIDSEPTDPYMIWDIALLTSGFEDRLVGWRGTGTSAPEFPIKTFNLTAGNHILIIRGRELNTYIGQITIAPVVVATLPEVATDPSPMDGETDVLISIDLSWGGGAGATTYDLKFGTVNPPPQVASGLTSQSYALGALEYSTPYFWQVIARNASGITPGPVWSFTTIPPKEDDPISSPNPANGAVDVSVNPVLRWNGVGTSYDIAFEDADPPVVVETDQIENSYTPSTLNYSTTYYWNVLAHRDSGDVQGETWSFTTIDAPTTVTVPRILNVV